jgi:membrane associated rhomboid family serine protease
MSEILSRLTDLLLGRAILVVALVVPVFAVTFLLVGGTDLLVAIGLPRGIAGGIAALLAIGGCVVGMGAFAKYAIDW